jgi:alpha,alpha-trehalase
LYTNEKFLRALKRLNENSDSKSIVDRATKKPADQVLVALENLNEDNLVEIEAFVVAYLYNPGVEIKKANLTDWQEEPAFLEKLKSDELKSFFKSINKIWLDLYKKFDESMLEEGCVSSHLPMKHSFVVPGGRFIEMYYWDTYWTIEGLLVCGMLTTVRQMIENFIYFIQLFGFIPNGSRVYYLNRSQPPYFSQIVFTYLEHVLNSDSLSLRDKQEIKNFVLDEALSAMIKEYEFWMTERVVKIKSNNNRALKLNIYKANTTKPRPESYFEDIQTAISLSDELKEKLFQDIASGAESGYDFSSRWFNNSMKLNSIETTDIIPVDLNAILYRAEQIISKLSYMKDDFATWKLFKHRAARRKLAINTILWSEQNKCWLDFNIKKNSPQSDNFYISNFSPLWFGIKPPNGIDEREIVNLHLKNAILDYNGVPCSYVYSYEQWDFPNVWAPNQISLVEMLLRFDRQLALALAKKFFNSIYSGWKANETFFEKYNALQPGKRGTGGEYEVQSGFGWTNGVALRLLEIFKDDLLDN